MSRSVRIALTVTVCLVSVGLTLAAGGTKKPDTTAAAAPSLTPEQEAMAYYNTGIDERDQAWKVEKQLAATSDPKQQEKLSRKRQKAYERAAFQFQHAVEKNPEMYQAYSDLGYCLRKIGDYESSIKHYDTALRIQPDYGNAIEYRAEAYLGLNRLDDAKDAYAQLSSGDRELAAKLLQAMQTWVVGRQEHPQGADPAEIDAFARWVDEQHEIVEQSKPISQLPRSGW